MTITATRRTRPVSFYRGDDYAPSTIGDYVAVDRRAFPWDTIGTALAGSSGTGTETDHLMSAAEVLTHTGLDLEVNKIATKAADTDEVIPHLFTTSYDDPEAGRVYFGAVSDKYHVVQPRDALGFFDEVVGQWEGAHYSAAWNMREKSMMGVTIELPDEVVIDPEGANDRVGMHLLGINSFDGTTALTGALVSTRWFCMNQVTPALRGAKRKFSLRHTRNVMGRSGDAAKMIGRVMDYARKLDEIGNRLHAVEMSDAAFERFLAKVNGTAAPVGPWGLTGDESDLVRARVAGRREEALATWRAPHNANITGTRWGALQVVAEFAEWGRTVNGSTRTGTDPERQRAIGTLVKPEIEMYVTDATERLVSMR